MTRLSRRSLFALGAAAGASVIAGCGDDTADPAVPPLPGGDTAAGSPADRAVWRVTGSPLVSPTGSGDLDGIELAVSDLFAVAGQQIGAGNPTWLAQAPREGTTAAAVARLLGAGAQVRGLTQVDDLGYGHSGVNDHYGTPPNHAATQCLPGGSTSGAAAAVGGGAAAGLGSDTGGSVRIPAAFQGLYGFTPTRGAVPLDGMLPLSPTLDTVGWLSGDLAVLSRVVTAAVPAGAGTGLDRAVTAPGVNAIAAPAVLAETKKALAAWKGSVPTLTEQDLDIGALPDWYDAVATVIGYEAWRQFGTFVSPAPAVLGEEPRDNFATAATISESAYRRARTTVDTAARTVTDYLGERVLVLPATASTPPSRSGVLATTSQEYRNAVRATGMLLSIATVAGLPTATLPMTATGDVPIALALVGPAHRDLDLLEVTHRVRAVGVVR